MKRGKNDDKSTGPMFPRLHVNDTEKGGPRAPPRNKMALYEQLSIPSQRFNASLTAGTRHEEDDFRVPIFDQQSETSQNRSRNHQNRENIQQENSQNFIKSASNQLFRQNVKSPLKATNESSSFNHRNGLEHSRRFQRNYNFLMEVQESPNDPINCDAVSETSIIDSICGVDISPDDVVKIIGQKHFWKARRAIVNQQRVFAVQVFELHRLIKVQRLIAESPHLLVNDNVYLTKPPKISPIKKIPLDYVPKSTINIPNHKIDLEKPNDDMEFSAENAVGKASLSSVQNESQTANCRPNMGFNAPAGHQWLIPVMSPSEGLVYKPYTGPGFVGPGYGGCGPTGPMPPLIGNNFPNYGIPHSDHLHHYDGPTMPPHPSHGYFPTYNTQTVNPSVSSSTRFEPPSSTNFPNEKNKNKNKPTVFPNMNFNNPKNNDVQVSTASSRSDKMTNDQNALPLFPASTPGPTRVIRVVPHNAKSATESVARIFQFIQEERKHYDSG